jgi:hypothetical protein
MSEKSNFEFDNLVFTEINFQELCVAFNRMLADMRSVEGLAGFQDYFESQTQSKLSLNDVDEEEIFEIARRYEDFLQSEFIDGAYELQLPDGVVNIYHQIETINSEQIPLFSVGIFNEELKATRKELLVNKNNNDVHY